MSYLLFKLAFDAPVHFGPSDSALSLYTSEDFFRADTLFSALCHTAGDELDRLVKSVQNDCLRFSDAMPWRGDTLFLPKPCFSAESASDISPVLRKKAKKLKWIPVSAMNAFTASLRGEETFIPQDDDRFGRLVERTRAAVSDSEDAVPYQVGAFRFDDDCGLWFIAECRKEDASWLEHLVTMLGYSGIGGKTSSGFGAFHLDDLVYLDDPFDDETEWLSSALHTDADRYLLLTSCLPAESELDAVIPSASFQLVRRGGFVQSDSYAAAPQKKQTQYFLSSGAVVGKRFNGGLFDVGQHGNHPVYRYSRPIFLGVDL